MVDDRLCHRSRSQLAADVRRWYSESLAGRALLNEVERALEDLLPELFGYYGLQIGAIDGERDLLGPSRVRHRATLDLDVDSMDLRGDPQALPFDKDSLDLIFMAHSLDFATRPHQVLREVERALVPEGHLIVLGFNPLSAWGMGKLTLGWRSRVPWCGRFYPAARTSDWLSLLGLRVVSSRYVMFRPPMDHPGILQRLHVIERLGSRLWPVLGGAYLILAHKRVATLTPIKPRWRQRALLPGKIAEPTTRA